MPRACDIAHRDRCDPRDRAHATASTRRSPSRISLEFGAGARRAWRAGPWLARRSCAMRSAASGRTSRPATRSPPPVRSASPDNPMDALMAALVAARARAGRRPHARGSPRSCRTAIAQPALVIAMAALASLAASGLAAALGGALIGADARRPMRSNCCSRSRCCSQGGGAFFPAKPPERLDRLADRRVRHQRARPVRSWRSATACSSSSSRLPRGRRSPALARDRRDDRLAGR